MLMEMEKKETVRNTKEINRAKIKETKRKIEERRRKTRGIREREHGESIYDDEERRSTGLRTTI